MAVLLSGVAIAARGGELRTYELSHYTLHTDLKADEAREVSIRLAKMAEEYHNRTRGFSGTIRAKMPFYIYTNEGDFLAAGATPGLGGFFNGRELHVLAQQVGPVLWHRMQHEGFHQFARGVIRGDLPTWVSEGMAEYFGEAVFTGDGFVSGVVPQWRLERVRKTMATEQFKSLDQMMRLSHEQWNSEMAVANYDQGWSMVQFLAHAENGKYQKAFGAFMGDLGRGNSWRSAWESNFGRDIVAFERKWRDYWTSLPDNPTADLYAKANVATLTSFLARATTQKQNYDSFGSFRQAASKGELKAHDQDWLPQRLLDDALKMTEILEKRGCSYELSPGRGDGPSRLICTTPEGVQVTGRYVTRGVRVRSVEAEISDAPR
jgi:hypothetical protein